MFGIKKKSELSDQEEMKRFQDGDESGFGVLLARHGPGVLRFIRKMTGADAARAEDLLQEIFMKVIERRGHYDPGQKFTTWLYSIARNHCIDFLRTESFRRHGSLDAPVSAGDQGGAVVIDMIRGGERAQDESVYDREVRDVLDEGLGELKEEFREVFLLREVEGLSLDEIAAVTGSPLGTVKSRLRYAYRDLRRTFTESGYFEERRKARGE